MAAPPVAVKGGFQYFQPHIALPITAHHRVAAIAKRADIIQSSRKLYTYRSSHLVIITGILAKTRHVPASYLLEALSKTVLRNFRLWGVEKFTPHDLRRTAASHMTGMGIPRLVVQ